MRITAKFNGRCDECHGFIAKDTEIEYHDKKAYHLDCVPTGDVDPDALGFLPHEDAVRKDWTK